MANQERNVVSASTTAPKLPDGVVDLDALGPSDLVDGCRVFTHYNGPTDQLSGMCAGMCVLEPGASPHPPHRHPEEEFLIIASGTGEIECAGKTTAVGPGAVMYCAGDVLHGVKNTGKVPMTFYWSKWLAKHA
jgi:mannose-6-phosphate isomerase-like protein (cupin superfamily)